MHKHDLETNQEHQFFFARFISNASAIQFLFDELYASHPHKQMLFEKLLNCIVVAYKSRGRRFIKKDLEKEQKVNWHLEQSIAGMSLYVDRFAGQLSNITEKISYLQELGVNLVHLMPIFESPEKESDGGYAVSDFRKVDEKFGDLNDLEQVQQDLEKQGMFLMLDIVLNHTSHLHQWAVEAKNGNAYYQDFFYTYPNREIPDRFEQGMPEVFPESSPGSFTYSAEMQRWVMTVFHSYQWDLNYTNPNVLVAMLENIFFYANLGVDILRLDAPAFIWKQMGTSCQNLPKAHTLLKLIKQAVQVVSPGMALLAEAIVAPHEIMKYFGEGIFKSKEADFAYNATQMAVQWDALATGDVRIMNSAQPPLLHKPFGTSWITYTRCHDDIGLGYDDVLIQQAGFNPYEHRRFIKNYLTGNYPGSLASGALFSVNDKTGDARISGTLASLCGLERALDIGEEATSTAIDKIILMQANSFFIGGIPMVFYGDEVGYTNDYGYETDPGKQYDNRWMHRPNINWEKNDRRNQEGSPENKIFKATQRLLSIRKNLSVVSDVNNIYWINVFNDHIAAFVRWQEDGKLICLFNYSAYATSISWQAMQHELFNADNIYDHWSQIILKQAAGSENLSFQPYQLYLLETK